MPSGAHCVAQKPASDRRSVRTLTTTSIRTVVDYLAKLFAAALPLTQWMIRICSAAAVHSVHSDVYARVKLSLSTPCGEMWAIFRAKTRTAFIPTCDINNTDLIIFPLWRFDTYDPKVRVWNLMIQLHCIGRGTLVRATWERYCELVSC